jgi:hypothetical protein
VKEVKEMVKENDKVEDKMMMNLEPPTTPMVILCSLICIGSPWLMLNKRLVIE